MIVVVAVAVVVAVLGDVGVVVAAVTTGIL